MTSIRYFHRDPLVMICLLFCASKAGVALATTAVKGDYNFDGIVNAADYTVYRNYRAGIGGTIIDSIVEVDTPGRVTIEDYNFWKSRYGSTDGSGSAISLPHGNVVPEPCSMLLIAVGALSALPFVSRSRSCRLRRAVQYRLPHGPNRTKAPTTCETDNSTSQRL